MSIQKLRSGRVPTATASTYIGEGGTIFWNTSTGEFRLSDGVTPGGSRVGFPVASLTEIGGIKLGPGVTLNGQDQLVVDPTGLDFAFGDFYAFTNTGDRDGACLSSVNTNQDVNIVSNGTGTINIVGEFQVHTTNSNVNDALSAAPVFSVSTDGQTKIIVPTVDPTTGAVEIIGSISGASQPTVNTGVMLHVTGNNGDASRIYNDGIGNFAAYVARRYNGTSLLPTGVLANEEIMRLSGTAHNGTSIPGSGNQRIVYRAIGNQTLTNQGGSIELWATAQNTTTLSKVATVDSTGITMAAGKVLTGNVTGDVSGNAGTVTNGVYTTDTGTVTNLMLAGSIANNKLANSAITVNGTTIALGATATVTAAAGTLTGTTLNATVVTSSLTSVGTLTALTVNGTGAFTRFTGKYIRNIRDAGTIDAGGTLTVDFSTDALIHCTWSDGITIAYQNYTAGSIVKIMATKSSGTGTDALNLGGLTTSKISSGSATQNYNADSTAFIELTCTGTTIGSVYAKL